VASRLDYALSRTPLLTLIGYFPKRIAPATAEMALPGVREIWSVSACISKTPDDWIQHWKHNECWAFDSCALAHSVVPPDDAESYVVLAYRVFEQELDERGARSIVFPASLKNIELDLEYRSIGFDAVTFECGAFGHSPLSCNGGAKVFPVNARCLFRTLEEALAGARQFAAGSWEPPPYRVVEVLARRGDAPDDL
jgi:hypothetical protein